MSLLMVLKAPTFKKEGISRVVGKISKKSAKVIKALGESIFFNFRLPFINSSCVAKHLRSVDWVFSAQSLNSHTARDSIPIH